MPRLRLPTALVVAAVVLSGLTVAVTLSGPASSATVPTPAHTVIVVMENHSYSQVIGAPYIASLAKAGANMTDSHGVRHPSEPNYLALWSGSTQGLTDDSCPHTYTGPSLGQQLLNAGKTPAIYSENLPAAGSLACSASGGYARKHNPLADFPATSGTATNLPYSAWPSDFSKLPTVSMVVPNLCDDMHDGSITAGDNWLRAHVDPYVQWARTHDSLLILTWDEDDNTTANRIPTIMVGPMVKPGNYGETINHYNVLHTVEAAYGLTQLGTAAAPITDVWGSTPSSSSSSVSPTVTATSSTPATSSAPPTSAPATSSAPPSSSTVTSSSPAPTSSTPSPPPPPVTPLRGAFWYGWYSRNWTQGSTFPATHYQPSAGFYSSTDPALIAYQIAGMQYAHLNFAIASWWGQGSQEDAAVPGMLAGAAGTPFKVSLYYENESLGDPSVATIQSDLAYLQSKYATNPNFLTISGKPVLFVYADPADGCGMADRWKQANADGAWFIVLKVFGGYGKCASQPDGWHQYAGATATDSQSGYSYTISPGFWKYNEATPRLDRDLLRWQTNIRSMLASNAPFQLVVSWNEWIEGSSVEDASAWNSVGPFGDYVDTLHRLIPGSP